MAGKREPLAPRVAQDEVVQVRVVELAHGPTLAANEVVVVVTA